ncbi:hypothetical protein FOL46_003685 [Perkinsus olseni]|uniref:Uncharacterized protein n=1 Tax=Perkinsus olseni TaxID=32597 RepID=A0A7J6M1R3_PEROL|nr:hypothetical protein FOL46_003685 [Perkinsus olseni]
MSSKQDIVGTAAAGLLSILPLCEGTGAVASYEQNNGYPPLRHIEIGAQGKALYCYHSNDEAGRDTWRALEVKVLQSGVVNTGSAVCPKEGDGHLPTPPSAAEDVKGSFDPRHEFYVPESALMKLGEDKVAMIEATGKEVCALTMSTIKLKHRTFGLLCDEQRNVSNIVIQTAEKSGMKPKKVTTYILG